MLSLNHEKYTRQEIINALHGVYGTRSLDYRFDLLDNQDRKIGDVSHLIVAGSSTIDMDNEAEIHRTAKFHMRDDGSINFLSDRIQPFVELNMPAVKRKHDNYGLSFDGVSDYVNLKNPNQLVNVNFTIEIDFTITSWKNSYQSLFSIRKGAGWNDLSIVILRNGSQKSLLLSISNGSTATTTNCGTPVLELNKKYRITGTFNGSQLKLYLDGVLVDEYTTTIIPNISTNTVASIGYASSSYYWNGGIFDVSLYNKALTNEEIQENKNKRLTGNESGLVGLWRLNEGTGTVAKDSTKNGNDGTINGATWQKNGIEIETIPSQNIEFPLGVFLLSTPSKSYQNRTIYRNIEAYDKLQILLDDGFTARYVADEGAYVTDVIIDIIQATGTTQINIERSDVQLPTWFSWDPDVSRLEVVNQLLQAINYEKIYVDEYGYFTSRPYRSPTVRTSEYEYKTDAWSVISPGATALQDFFAIPNQWVGIISEPDRVPLTYTYENLNEDSPTSIPNRGRTVTKYIDVDAADIVSLQGIVQKKAFEDSQIYTEMTFQTALMPMHSHNDIYHLQHDILGVNAKFQELKWSMTLSTGSLMSHTAREIIPV